MELYANIFTSLYGLEMIGLRYFNVFGPKQNPNGSYAAVIPLFITALIEDKPATINGDGSNSRDFTYISNVVQANISSLFTERQDAVNQVYNVACGERVTLKQLYEMLQKIAKSNITPIYGVSRKGDIPHSLADISKIQQLLDYKELVKVDEGLKKSLYWYHQNLK
jgi:UDP-N-acetylglucosamine 4-epimerase